MKIDRHFQPVQRGGIVISKLLVCIIACIVLALASPAGAIDDPGGPDNPFIDYLDDPGGPDEPIVDYLDDPGDPDNPFVDAGDPYDDQWLQRYLTLSQFIIW